MENKLTLILKLILFILSLVLIVYGQRTVGRVYLLMQLVGLIGLIGLLWSYNKNYIK